MKTNTFQAFCLATTALTVPTTAHFTVEEGKASNAAGGYVKEWTMTGKVASDIVDTIELNLAGTAFVSIDKSLPSGVLGKVKATSDLQSVTEAITVRNTPNPTSYPNNGVLNVTSVGGMNGGNLLTEITLSSNSLGMLDVHQSAQVVVKDEVLANDLSIDVGGSSALFVSASKTNMDLKDLSLSVSDSARVQIDAKSLSIGDASIDVGKSATVSVLAPTLKTSDISASVGGDGTICFAAADASTGDMSIDDGIKVAFPNSSNKFGTTGTFQCDDLKVPARNVSSTPISSITSAASSGTSAVPSTGSGSSVSTDTSAAATNLSPTNVHALVLVGLVIACLF